MLTKPAIKFLVRAYEHLSRPENSQDLFMESLHGEIRFLLQKKPGQCFELYSGGKFLCTISQGALDILREWEPADAGCEKETIPTHTEPFSWLGQFADTPGDDLLAALGTCREQRDHLHARLSSLANKRPEGTTVAAPSVALLDAELEKILHRSSDVGSP